MLTTTYIENLSSICSHVHMYIFTYTFSCSEKFLGFEDIYDFLRIRIAVRIFFEFPRGTIEQFPFINYS